MLAAMASASTGIPDAEMSARREAMDSALEPPAPTGAGPSAAPAPSPAGLAGGAPHWAMQPASEGRLAGGSASCCELATASLSAESSSSAWGLACREM